MPTSELELKNIAALAYLDIDANNASQLAEDISTIMDFVEELRQMDTGSTAPLLHPLDIVQRLRSDSVLEKSCIEQLAKIAPLFADNLYLVPKVIDTGK